jgi:hypothetical protein
MLFAAAAQSLEGAKPETLTPEVENYPISLMNIYIYIIIILHLISIQILFIYI